MAAWASGLLEVGLSLPEVGRRQAQLSGIAGWGGRFHARLRRRQLLAAAVELLIDSRAGVAGVGQRRQQREDNDRDYAAEAGANPHGQVVCPHTEPTLSGEGGERKSGRPRRPLRESRRRLGARPVAGQKPQHHQQDHRADQRNDKAEDVATARDVEEVRSEPAANDAADDTHDYIDDNAVAVAAHKASRKRASNPTDDDRPKPADSFHTRTSRKIR